jgi:hypothetical protein
VAWGNGENDQRPDAGYNGLRRLFYNGKPSGDGMFTDGSGLHTTWVNDDGTPVRECDCPTSNLILAPEDKDVIL